MSFKWKEDPTPEMIDLVCRGELCPQCFGVNIKCVGSNPDGRDINYAYDCLECDAKWEGY